VENGQIQAMAVINCLGYKKMTEKKTKKRYKGPKFTEKTRQKIYEAARLGVTQGAICAFASIDRSSLSKWLRQGKEDIEAGLDTDKADFVRKYDIAIDIWEVEAVVSLKKAAEQDPKITQWLLSRRRSEAYGQSQTIKADITADVTVENKSAELTQSMLAQLLKTAEEKDKEETEADD